MESAQPGQKVHSKLQMNASAPHANPVSHFSQISLISSAIVALPAD